MRLITFVGEGFGIELLQTADVFEEMHQAWGINSLTEKLYLLTPKPK